MYLTKEGDQSFSTEHSTGRSSVAQQSL